MSLHTLRLLHISDIHMRGGREKEGWRRREVLGPAWQKNIDDLLLDGPIDLICLTGDVANTGQPDEYEDATVFIEELLKRVGQPMQRLFVVPGNHDIDRGLAKRAWNALRKYLPGTDPLDTSRWLASGRLPTTRGLSAKHLDEVFLRQRAYQEWSTKTLGRPELLPGKSPHGRLGYRVKLDIPSLPFPVFLIGLDSAWLAGDDSDAENLRLTDDQIMRLATEESGAPLPGLRLALVHHPLHSLADHTDSRQRLAKHVDLLLRGHLHREDTSNELRPDGALFQIAAGCLYEGSKANAYPNSCQVLTLTLNEQGKLQRFELRFRTWSSRGHWHDDPGRYSNAPRGRLSCVRRNTAEGESWQFSPADENQGSQLADPATASPERKRVSVGLESVLDGMRTLPAGPQVRKFLDTYLGTREHPEPFGGRTKELQELRRWFDAPGPPSMVVSAPAGCGKSALLCRFCVELIGRPEVALVYFPISIRYQTSLENRCLPALVSRLCHLYGDSLPKIEHTSPDQWRLLLDHYLTRSLPDGRTLLLILDGLDETTGWLFDRTLLPVQPASRVRILVAARTRVGEMGYEGWRQTLGWASPAISQGLSLSGLSVDDVAEAIASLGMPLDRVAQRSELVVQLHRLSRGEPLLVQLWCHRLWQVQEQALTLAPAQLEKYPPGLKGYLQEFWEARKPEEKTALHERGSAQLLLEILASALGPLGRADLLALMPEIRSVVELKDALAPMARFVDGDGLEQGYVLRHSLLRDHFREEEMTTEQCLQRDARFLGYGERHLADLMTGRIHPQEVSSYLLQNLGSHIQNATSQDGPARAKQHLALVNNAWRRAWEFHENGAGGFLNDVERAWEAACTVDLQRVKSGQPSLYFTAIVRSAVCVAAQRTRSHGIFYRLFEGLVKRGVWSVRQALAFVQQMKGVDDPFGPRKKLFAFLIPRLPDDLLRRALEIALEMTNAEHTQDELLFALWERLAKVCPHEAVSAVYGINRRYLRLVHMAALARHLPIAQSASLYAEALALVSGFPGPGIRAADLERLAEYAPEDAREGLIEEAFALALIVPSSEMRAFRLRMLLPKLPKRFRRTALDAMLDATLPLQKEHDGLSIMDVLGSFHPSTQHRVLRRIWSDPRGSAACLNWLTSAIHAFALKDTRRDPHRWRILETAVGIDACESLVRDHVAENLSHNPGSVLDLIVTLASAFRPALLIEVLTIFRQSAPAWALAGGLCLFGHHISSSETIEGLQLLFRLKWPSDGAFDRELLTAFSHLTETEREQALAMVAEVKQPQTKAWASYWLAGLFTGMRQQQLLEQAALAAPLIPSAQHRADLLIRLLPDVSADRTKPLLEAGLAAIDAMKATSTQIRALARLAAMLVQPYRDQLLHVAVSEVPKLERNIRKAAVLKELLETPGISDELREAVFREALRAVRASKPVYAPDLTDLSRHAPSEQQKELLHEAWAASRTLQLRMLFLQTAFVLRPSVECQRGLLQHIEQMESDAQLVMFFHYAWPNMDKSLQPELLRRSLETIRSLPEHNTGRLGYRNRLLELVPLGDREAIARDAIRVAHQFLAQHQEFLHQALEERDSDVNQDQVEISRALQAVLPRLFEQHLALADAVALVPLIPQTWYESQAAALCLFSAEESAQRLEVLRTCLAELPKDRRAHPLAVLAIRLCGAARTQAIAEALSLARAVLQGGGASIDYRPQVLNTVAPYVEPVHMDAFIGHIVACCQGGQIRINLSHLMERLSGTFQQRVIAQLLGAMADWPTHIQDQVLVSCSDHVGTEWYERVALALPRVVQPSHIAAIGRMVIHLPERILLSVLTALAMANGSLAPSHGQAAALAVVGTELLRRSPTYLTDIWPIVQATLRRSTANVQGLNQMIQNLAPLLRSTVGVDGVERLIETLLELSDWWEEC